MKKLLIATAILVVSPNLFATMISVGDKSEFKPLEENFHVTGVPIGYEDINLISKGLDKDTVALVLGTPHYGTGLLPAKKWEYRFNIVTPDNAIKDCQTLVEFDQRKVQTMKVSSHDCLMAIAYRPKQVEPRGERIIERVINDTNRLPVRAEALFAFNKHSSKDITNSIDWKELASKIIKDNAQVVRLIGFTDQSGSFIYNLELASKRSDTVFTNLVKHGVNPEIIEINNLGKTQSFNQRKVQIHW